jgi:hypothetical protein
MGNIDETKYYVSIDEIKERLNNSTALSDDTIKEIIERKMLYIDEITGNVYNGRQRRMEELHSINEIGYDKAGFYFSSGYIFPLMKMYIDKVESIKIIYSNPDDYRDLIEENPKPDRFKTWWMDFMKGIIYLKTFMLSHGGKEILIRYTYGRDDLPPEIKELCMLLVIQEIYSMDLLIASIPDFNKSSQQGFVNYINNRIEELVRKTRLLIPMLEGLSMNDLGEV